MEDCTDVWTSSHRPTPCSIHQLQASIGPCSLGHKTSKQENTCCYCNVSTVAQDHKDHSCQHSRQASLKALLQITYLTQCSISPNPVFFLHQTKKQLLSFQAAALKVVTCTQDPVEILRASKPKPEKGTHCVRAARRTLCTPMGVGSSVSMPYIKLLGRDRNYMNQTICCRLN